MLPKTSIVRSRFMVWVLAGCIFIVLFLSSIVLYAPLTINEPLDPGNKEKEIFFPWWEADDCECDEETCQPRITLRNYSMSSLSGTCGQKAWAAGDGQKVVSFSLYGDNPEYWQGLGQILQEIKKLYPGWRARLYTNPRGHGAVICPLLHHYPLLQVCDVTNLPPPLNILPQVHPMMWRVAPLGDPQVTAMIVRDTDSEVTEREMAAVEEWLHSGKTLHLMRDHPQHTSLVMGGMWGARWDLDPTLTSRLGVLRNKMLRMAVNSKKYGYDQRILSSVLYPEMAGQKLVHDSYLCQKFRDSSPWPTQRINGSFVGSPRLRKMYAKQVVPHECPKQCRPPAHQEWLYC